jgi:FAD dependent oxidoreductase TIGR03364
MADAADVLVVGGGVLGLAHALAALKAGYTVALVERSTIPRGASVRNFGMVWPIGQPSGEQLELALRSRQIWSEVAKQAGFRMDPTGSLHLAYSDDEWAVLREFKQRSSLSGLQLLDPDEVLAQQRALVPRDLRGALFSPHEANLDPPVVIAALHRWLQTHGAAIHCGSPVVKVEDGCAVLADRRHINAHRILICSGDEFRLLFPEVFAGSDLWKCKLQMLSFRPQPPQFRLGPMMAAGLTLMHYKAFAECPTMPRLRKRLHGSHQEYLHRGIHVMVAQGDDGRLLVGDSHEYGEIFTPGIDVTTERLICDYLDDFLQPTVRTIERRWTGVYALSRSGAPVFRATPRVGVEIITGVGGSGMTKSMALGEATVASWSVPSL